MSILIACYLTTIVSLAIAVHMQRKCLPSSLSTRVLYTQTLCIEIRCKNSQCGIVADILAISNGILAVGSSDDGLVHAFTDERYLLRRRFLTCSHLHHLFIDASLYINGSLGPFSNGIHGSLYSGIVAVAAGIDGYCVLGAGTCHEPQHQTDAEKLVIHVATILVLRNDAQDGIL